MSKTFLQYLYSFEPNSPMAVFLDQRTQRKLLSCILFQEQRRDKKPRDIVLGIKDLTTYVQVDMNFGRGQCDVGELFVKVFEILATELKLLLT